MNLPTDNNYLRVANYLNKYVTKADNIGYNAKRYFHTTNLNFKNKLIGYLSDEEFKNALFKEGIEKVKDTEKIEVYRYTINKRV